MLAVVGAGSLDELIDQTLPASIRLTKPPGLDPPMSEFRFLRHMRDIASRNHATRSFLGLGFHNCITPSVIQRTILENPGWYTQYTPYQAEISQGRLEALLNFQTMICDLTAMEVANASLLDESTAAAEAMVMTRSVVSKQTGKENARKYFVGKTCLPQTIDVLRTRAKYLGIEVVVDDHTAVSPGDDYFGALLQYPDVNGLVSDYRSFIEDAHRHQCLVTVSADLLSLALLLPPGEFGADIVVGTAQRFGVPLGYGGPHAAFFATHTQHLRNLPGRIIGVSVDAHGSPALRMTLQTREQHIRREKATSNICTAQALLAIMAGMYAVYHGPRGIKSIAQRVHSLTARLDRQLQSIGFEQANLLYFDTLALSSPVPTISIREEAERHGLNFRYVDEKHFCITLDETTQDEDLEDIVRVCAAAAGRTYKLNGGGTAPSQIDPSLARTSKYLEHPVFNMYHSETELMRYIKWLENKDLSLTHSMIPLGSCTMKLNAATELMPLSWPQFSSIHPYVPATQTEGYQKLFSELERQLCAITGLSGVSFQPNSGAQGEYAGLLVIRAYHDDRNEPQRNVALIPASAHGTNPASAVLAGMNVVVVKSDSRGNIDVDDLRRLAGEYHSKLAALMVTYPSTHGIFEEQIREICAIVHEHGGQVYMDGANLNAQVGLTSPAMIGADVCHINLHKTFSIPHGGGGPGMGPICVAPHLVPYLPGHPFAPRQSPKAITAIASAPWGSASILVISYAYIKMLGAEGATAATRVAILNANYLKSRLEAHFPVLFQGPKGRCAHEFILDFRQFKTAGIEVEDIAKRLMDYGFHAPTVSFPVPGTLMIEPTESESKRELDRFVDALSAIRKEIQDVVDGKADGQDNVLKNAPHTVMEIAGDDWSHPYPRSQAAFPLPHLQHRKFWPSVGRINNSYGDRNIMCVCPPIEAYMDANPNNE